jgi:hypothetical protein
MELNNKELQRAIFKSNSFEMETAEYEGKPIIRLIIDNMGKRYSYDNTEVRNGDFEQIKQYIREMESFMFM